MIRRSALVLATASILLCTLSCSAKTVYVKWDSPGPTFDGTTWDTGFHTVPAGLAAAVSGDEVWVARGKYVERITLKSGVGLYGGFIGAETSRDQRDFRTNKTVLDCSSGGSVVETGYGLPVTSVIDGFVIRSGHGSDGGAIYSYQSAVTITNNVLVGNSGAAIGCLGGSPTIANNMIIGNLGGETGGGGIACRGSSPKIVNNVIAGNTGAGIFCDYTSPATIYNNVIVGNTGSGILCTTSSPTITNNTIVGNGGTNGGGISCSSASSPAVSNNIVAFNASGVLKISGAGSPVLRNNCVYGNTAYDYSGISAGAGDSSADPLLADLVHGNAHIQPGSPCIDSGDDTFVQTGWTDIDGQARTQGAHVDIGADESDGTTWTAGPYGVVRVSTSGDDGNDGSTWALAKRTVQAGIDAASAIGGEVWVAAGTYNERIVLHPYTYLYGGFDGTEILRSERDWTANAVVLDGGSGGSVVTIRAGRNVSAIDGFTIRNGTGSSLTTYGSRYGGGINCSYSSPTIANNTITGNTASGALGGGIYCSVASPTIVNNVITGNSASSTAANDSYGGGIYCVTSSPTITNNTITGNGATQGGGLYCDSSSPALSNNILASNSSGIFVKVGSTPALRNNCVNGNADYDYNGVSAGLGDISTDPLFGNGGFGNFHIRPESPCADAGWNGAPGILPTDVDGQARLLGIIDIGADESNGAVWPVGPTIVVRVSPSGDDANDGSTWALAKRSVQAAINAASKSGGEVWVKAGTYDERIVLHPYAYLYGGFAGIEMARSERRWASNVTILDGGSGGSVVTARTGRNVSAVDGFTIRNGSGTIAGNSVCGGGIYCSFASPTIANNTITGNTVLASGDIIYGHGGGIYCLRSSPIIANNTVANNSASYYGGGIYCSYSSATVANNTIVGNASRLNGGSLHLNWSSSVVSNNIVAFNSSGIRAAAGTPTLRNNCVYGNTDSDYSGITAGTGDIAADPMLADTLYGNFHIQPTSPCVNAGWNGAPGLPSLDMDGQPRVQGGIVDIGTDEYPMSPYIIVRVSPTGNDANDGSSWDLAKRTVQEGIDAASAIGGQVWVKAGTYNERIILHPYAYLYGGFNGTETMRSERDWRANVTILDGGAGGAVVRATAGQRVSAIDGFTIRNGTGDAVAGSRGGGGICCTYASPAIANNTITGNTLSDYSANGGGILCHYCSPTIVNNVITGNRSGGSGGGVYALGGSPIITNNTISDNWANSSAGGVRCADDSILSHNIIVGNTASSGSGGGIYCSDRAKVYNNLIAGNVSVKGWQSTSRGGGITCGGTVTLANNTIVGNLSAEGGAIYTGSSPNLMIANNIIAFNSSGFFVEGTVSPILRSNCIYGNLLYDFKGITDPTGTNGNIKADPKLVRFEYGEMHVQPDSPCVDSGDADSVTWSADIDGEARILGERVDIGYDESIGEARTFAPAIVRVSPEGNDANDGLSWEHAKLTVQAAIDTAANLHGDVWVKAGLYNELVTMKRYTNLYGGFAGTETERSQRNASANISILDAQATGSVITIRNLGCIPVMVDGLTIRNGQGPREWYSGGITWTQSLAHISNNIITGNSVGFWGGGVFCDYGLGSLSDNIITANRSGSGGGIYITSLQMDVSGNTISDNRASYGAGVYLNGPVRLVRNRITGNIANSLNDGGGVFCQGTSDQARCIVDRNIISSNQGDYAGGICSRSCSDITNNLIIGNNGQQSGGGILLDGAYMLVANNTIVGNTCSNINYRTGGGIEVTYSSGSVTLANNIVLGNSTGITRRTTTDPVTLHNNCVLNNNGKDYLGITPDAGSISVDPMFVDEANGDYHLQFTSPCMNAGWNVPGLPTTDMDGDNRILYGAVDIGADELSGSAAGFREARMMADNKPISLTGAIATAVFEGFFYIEANDRSCGMRVEKPEHGVEAGEKVNVTGVLKTNADGERLIEASSVEVTGTGSIAPLHINAKSLGGGDWFYNPSTGAGQCGVVGGFGLNNIGLLVTTWGKISYADGAYALDLGADKTVRILAEGMSVSGAETYCRITGISSCYRDTDGLHPTIRVTEIAPVQ